MQCCQPGVHPVVDERVEHGVGHGQPVESQVDVLDEGLSHDLLVVVRVDEVGVIGEPADGENNHDDDEHLHDLKKNVKEKRNFKFRNQRVNACNAAYILH